MDNPRERKFILLLTVFISCISILNIISAKLWTFSIFGGEYAFSAGVLAYGLTFPVTDVVAEVFGHARAQWVVWMGFVANICVLFLTTVAIHVPPATAIYPHQEAFATVLGSVPVIVFASLTAYIVAQTHDVAAFRFWKRVTKGKHLWVRNNLSTIGSQLLDSLIFNGIAFWLFAEVKPSLSMFISMTVAYWLFKVAIAVIDTPVVYLLVHWLRKDENCSETKEVEL